MQKKEVKKTWYQIEIENDISDTSGKELIALLEYLNTIIQIEFIVIDDLDGAIGELLSYGDNQTVMSFQKFIKAAKPAQQFEWGYFFLFSKKENAEKLILAIKSKEPTQYDFVDIPDTLTTIRVFDNTSFIIYTSNPKIAEVIRKQYPMVKIENKDIEQLGFYF